jgi:hypothetical protein
MFWKSLLSQKNKLFRQNGCIILQQSGISYSCIDWLIVRGVSEEHVSPSALSNSPRKVFVFEDKRREFYIESMGQSQQTQLYCSQMAYVY